LSTFDGQSFFVAAFALLSVKVKFCLTSHLLATLLLPQLAVLLLLLLSSAFCNLDHLKADALSLFAFEAVRVTPFLALDSAAALLRLCLFFSLSCWKKSIICIISVPDAACCFSNSSRSCCS
jgi:hypothetical protein